MPEEKKTSEPDFVSRPPVVVVLGHVDSGKTSILDSVRKAHVVDKESGGITQHVGAYEVEVPRKEEPKSRESEVNRGILRTAQDDFATRKIVFIDTPGHEAFSAMRSRGAKVADIAILVVDAVSGVQPQTKEAISHIKKSGISLIVAINKIDLREARPEKIKEQLMKEGVQVESFGGQVPVVEVSAKTGLNIEHLLEMVLLIAEMEGLKADLESPPEGVVVEAYLDNSKGPLATVLLRAGRLSLGQIVGTPTASGKIRGLFDFRGQTLTEALPSLPVVVLGLSSVPQVGEKLKAFASETEAGAYVQKKEKKKDAATVVFAEEGKKILNFILKADVSGSLEAIEQVLTVLPQDKIVLRLIEKSVGEINESDVKLAQASQALIIGFRVKTSPLVQSSQDRTGVKILSFDIIYALAQGVRQVMESLLSLETERKLWGWIKILVVFMTEKNRQIVGGKVLEGVAKKGVKIQIWREEQNLGRGRIVSLQENKRDVAEVPAGRECGMLFEGDARLVPGDRLELFEENRKRGEL